MSTLTLSSNVNNDISGVAPFDIYLGPNGNISQSYDQQALLEACAQAANTLLGEMIYNTTEGIPFFQVVWIGTPNITQYTAALRSAFLAVGGGGLVTQVVSITVSQTGDILNYNAIISTIYGASAIAGTAEPNNI